MSSDTTIEATFEVLPPDVATASTELSCPSDKVMALYQPFAKPFENAAALLAEEETATAPADARALRLKMVKARTAITATKDESKSDIKLAGNIIDWFHNKGRDRLASAEARLMEIEKAEERAEAARIAALATERKDMLDTLGHDPCGIALGMLTDDQWAAYHQQAKDAFLARRERERKAKEEAEAAAKKEAEEREAQRLENIRLKAEAEAREKELAEERRIAAEKEAAAKAEREAIEAAAKAEREKAEKERQAAEEKARKEREAIELQAAKERAEAEAKARIEAEARAKAEAEAKALRDAEAKRIAEEKAAAEAKAKAEALAAKKAAAAPDKAKLMEFADKVRSLVVPLAKSEAGREVAAEINRKVESFAKWIETQAATL